MTPGRGLIGSDSDDLPYYPDEASTQNETVDELCREPVALYWVTYGEQYDPCTKPVGHDGPHDPSANR